jgi:hypothetical protein
VALAPLFIG